VLSGRFLSEIDEPYVFQFEEGGSYSRVITQSSLVLKQFGGCLRRNQGPYEVWENFCCFCSPPWFKGRWSTLGGDTSSFAQVLRSNPRARMVGRGMTGGHWVLHGGGRSGGFDGGMNAPRESGASFLYRGGDDRRGGPQGG